MAKRERERETETERDRERQTDRQRQRQTDRQTDRQDRTERKIVYIRKTAGHSQRGKRTRKRKKLMHSQRQ